MVPSKFSIITSHIPFYMPFSHSHIPALYYGVSICLVTFASAMAVVTLNIHHMGLRGKDVSSIILSIFTLVSTYRYIIGIFISNEYTSTRGQESPALIHHRRRNSQGPLSSLPLTTHSRALHRSPPQAFHPKLSHQLSNLFIVITFPLKITQRALTAAPSLTKSFAHICTFLTFHFHSTCP